MATSCFGYEVRIATVGVSRFSRLDLSRLDQVAPQVRLSLASPHSSIVLIRSVVSLSWLSVMPRRVCALSYSYGCQKGWH